MRGAVSEVYLEGLKVSFKIKSREEPSEMQSVKIL